MSAEQFQAIVRKPVAELEAELRERFHIGPHPLRSVSVEGGSIVFLFGAPEDEQERASPSNKPQIRSRRRRRAQRNRTKTRGWNRIATVVNSLGQRVRIYDVFANALTGQKLTRVEQRKAVERIIRSNGNEPTRDQVDYFLGNTLEFLKSRPAGGGPT